MSKEELRLPSDTLLSVIRRASDTFGIPMDLLIAIAWQETRYKSTAIGSAGERGIYQMLEPAWCDAGSTLPSPMRQPRTNAWDDTVSTLYACRYLYWLNSRQRIGSLKTVEGIEQILQAWNGGVGNFKRKTIPTMAKRYAKNVIEHMKRARTLLEAKA